MLSLFFFFLGLSKHLVEHLPKRVLICVWVERASGDAIVILQSELVPWIELHKAHSLPSLCTQEHQLSQGQILRGSIEFRTAHQGNEVLSKDHCYSCHSSQLVLHWP